MYLTFNLTVYEGTVTSRFSVALSYYLFNVNPYYRKKKLITQT